MTRIVWTAAARRDVNAIWDFIASENPAAAEIVDSRILSTVAGLTEHPRRGRPGRVAGTRELVIPGLPYIVVYATSETQVAIVRVIHAARRWPKTF